MIPKYEIMEHAKQYNLPANTIEKDYILNWLLCGAYSRLCQTVGSILI